MTQDPIISGTVDNPSLNPDGPIEVSPIDPVIRIEEEPELVHPKIDIINAMKLDVLEMLARMNVATNAMAEDIRAVREPMVGKGVNPIDSRLTVYKLQQVENSLRALATQHNIPWLIKK